MTATPGFIMADEEQEPRESDDPYWNDDPALEEASYDVDASDEESEEDDTSSTSQYRNGELVSREIEQKNELRRNRKDPPVVHRPPAADNSDSSSTSRSRSQNIVLTPAQLSEIQDQNERRSARFVKRKKFADEIVEASLRPAYYRNRNGTEKLGTTSGKSTGHGSHQHDSVSPRNSAAAQAVHHERSTKRKSGKPTLKVPPTASEAAVPTKPKQTKKSWSGNSTVALNQNFGYGGSYEPYDQESENGASHWDHEPEDLSGSIRAPMDQQKKPSRSTKKKPPAPSDESVSRKAWAAMDDLKLISALPQLIHFGLVAKYVSFSTKVEARFLEQRWTELLNDPEACRETVEGLDRIPLDTTQRIRKMKFFTEAEEEMVKTVTAGNANLEHFERILLEFPYLFFPGRVPEDLLACWKYLSQRVKTDLGSKEPPESNPELPEDLSALYARNRIDDIQSGASCFGQALISYTAHLNYRSKHVGCEVAYLKALSERVATATLPDQQRPKFHRDHKSTLAFLCGVCVDYAIINDEATFGYSDENTTVDIDLSLEGNIVNLVPLQGVIYLDVDGMFHIENFGFSTISINGFLLERGNEFDLPDNSAVDIGTLTFQFYKNTPAVKKHIERATADFVSRSRGGRSSRQDDGESGRSMKPEPNDDSVRHDLSDSPPRSDSSESVVNGGHLYMDVEDDEEDQPNNHEFSLEEDNDNGYFQ